LAQVQAAPPAGLEGAIVSMQGRCIVLWTHWQGRPSCDNLLDGVLALDVITNETACPARVPMPVTVVYPGIEVGARSSFNFRFDTGFEVV